MQSGDIPPGLKRMEPRRIASAAGSTCPIPASGPMQFRKVQAPARADRSHGWLLRHRHHHLPPSSERTLATALDRCAFTVPSFDPVAATISLSSCSST
jgi:hypothetical protein